MNTWRIHVGDVRERLLFLDPGSVQTCVTSPPYFGLRDYGMPGQIGLEPSPEAYVARLVDVFREVRRVLADDGTLWLNLGSSYAASGERQTGCNDGGRPEKGRGWAEYDIRRTKISSRGSGPSQSPSPERVPAYGSDGTAPLDSQETGSSYSGLCDGCSGVLSSASTEHSIQPGGREQRHASQIGRDNEHSGSAVASRAALLPDAQASTTTQSSELPPGECSHCANCDACLSVLRSSLRDASLCVRKAGRIGGSVDHGTDGRTSGTGASGMAWLNYTFKPKDLIPIPWMVAMALQQDGWFLRCDVIWSKCNPMPESVRDRPTKAHEYIFLLSKSARYYYDSEAIKEAVAGEFLSSGVRNPRHGRPGGLMPWEARGDSIPYDTSSGARRSGVAVGDGRNKRSVWHVATQPYSGAHFATFPEALIEPCILAGSRIGDTVLDPFAGSGTTGAVAIRRQRSFIGCELNPEYAKLAERRIGAVAPLFSVGGVQEAIA